MCRQAQAVKSSEDGSKNNKDIRTYEETVKKKIVFVWCYKHICWGFKFVCAGGVFLIHSFFSYILLEILSLFHCKSKQVRIGINIGRLWVLNRDYMGYYEKWWNLSLVVLVRINKCLFQLPIFRLTFKGPLNMPSSLILMTVQTLKYLNRIHVHLTDGWLMYNNPLFLFFALNTVSSLATSLFHP